MFILSVLSLLAGLLLGVSAIQCIKFVAVVEVCIILGVILREWFREKDDEPSEV